MKHLSLITGSDLRMVMGVNYFLKSFIQCNELFKEIKINRIYSGTQTLNVEEGEQMPIGSDLGSTEYRFRRGFRTILKWILTDKFYPFALFRYQMNLRLVSKASVERFFSEDAQCDYIIFQELGVAEYYFKHKGKYPKMNDVKTMLVIHSEDDSCSMTLELFKGYGKRDMRRRLYKMRDYVYSHVNKVVYISRKAYESSILPIEKRAFVYNGSPVIPLQYHERKNPQMQFVCVGSIEGRKGQDIIIEAMSKMKKEQLQKLHMTFVGGGSKEDETIKMAKQYGLDSYVSFMGRRNDVPEILQSMDVFIMPSTIEGLPMSAIEAMRAGLFLILTDTGGNAELCDEGCGIVCTRDIASVMSAMCRVLDGKIIGEEQKAQSHARFLELFSLKSMAKGYETTLLSM